MSTTFPIVMGDRGRLVVPADVRERQGWVQGAALLLVETDEGVVLTTREQAKAMLRAQLAGDSLVEQLMAERRLAATADDAQ
jgi:bifunctional DNA-binding transcriptional regulator/antitoxin component of YhaV-PrlF toxin-antitoxin module